MTPRRFLALHVYTPPSCDVTSRIISLPRDCTIRLFKGLQPCDLGCWVSFDLTLQWGYTSFVYHHGHWRWHNRRSWDGFTIIALGSLSALMAFRSRRPLISLSAFVSFRSLGSTRSGRTMLAWGTRPSSSSPYSSLAVYLWPGYSGPAGLLFWCRHSWLLHSCLISCFYFLSCVCGDCVFLQLNNKHNGW